MKSIVLIALLTIFGIFTVSGQIKIGDNPQNIDPASLLELESSSRVLVISRVSTPQMEAIAPQRGGVVYNTDTECLHYFDGTQWVNLCDAVSFNLTNDPIENSNTTISIVDNGSSINLEVAPNSIRSENIVDGGINGDDIQDNSIGESKLGDDSVSSNELRDNSVGSSEIRDGSVQTTDMANTIPNQVMTSDENGIVLWRDASGLQGATGDEITITGAGTIADPLTLTDAIQNNINDNTVTLATHILEDSDTDDQNETLTDVRLEGNNLVLTESGIETTLDLGPLNNSGTDNQTLNLAGNILEIERGNTVNLNGFLDNTDEQQLSINPAGTQISLTNGGTINLPAGTVNTDNQNLSLTGNTINISGGTGVDLTPILGGGATDGVVTNVVLAGNDLNFTGANGGFNGSVSLAGLGGGAADGVITNMELIGTDLVVTGTAPGFSGTIPLGTLGGGTGSTEEADQTTITGIGTNADPFKIEPGAQGEFLTTDAGGLVSWTNAGPGGGTTELVDGTTILGLGTATDPFRVGSIGSTEITDASIGVIDITPAGATPATTQVLTTNTVGTVEWIDLPTGGAGSTQLADQVTIVGDGQTGNEFAVADAGITPIKIEPSATPGQFLSTDATGNVVWDNLPPSGGITAADIAFVPTGNTESNEVQAAITELQSEIDGISLGGAANPTDELNQSFQVNGSNLEITDAAGTFQVPLNLINTDEQTAGLVPVEATPVNYAAATPDVEAHLAGIDVALATSVANPTDEIQDLQLTTDVLTITNNVTATPIDLTPYLDNTDEQTAELVPVAATPANYTAATPDVEAHLAGIDAVLATSVANPTDEIQDLQLTTDVLTITNNATATPIDLTPYLDNTDAQTADLVPVAATPVNYAVTAPDVEAHLAGIDAVLATSVANPTDEIQDLQLTTDILTITNNATATPIDLTPYLDNTDAQTADLVPVAATPVNYTAATPDVEAHLAGIDAVLATSVANPTDEIQDLQLTTDVLTITNNAAATPIDLTPYLDDTDEQTAELVPVAATPANYTAATPDVEAHLAGIDVALLAGTGGENLFSVNGLNLTADRTHTLGGNNFILSGAGNIGIGNLPGAPQSKLDVAGQIQARGGFAATGGTAITPSIGFYTDDDTNTGMFRPAADEIGFSVGAQEAMRIEEDDNDTNVIIFQSLQLGNLLLDKDGESGTAGQILSSTGGQTDWINPPTGSSVVDNEADDGLSNFDGANGYDINVDDATIEIDTDALRVKGSANNGEVLTTVGGIATWAAPTAGAVNVDGTTIEGNGTTVNLSVRTGGITSTQILDDTITNADMADDSIDNDQLQNDSVTADKIVDGEVYTEEIQNGTIINEDISPTAAIAGSKINPDFDDQNIQTTGTITSGAITANGVLQVNGDVNFTGTHQGIPDYVFQEYFTGYSSIKEDYKFGNLKEVENFVKKHHHLPGVTSAAQAKKNGFWSLSQSNLQNLEKIEELFLHTIEQEKKIEALVTEKEALAQKLERLEKDMDMIKQLLQTKNDKE
ncbi:hypothetical protein EJ994_01095 [Maribacter sp. MJ134]|uniref:beta strand repeat-containing protein n=1 Tax=Maribacter sp. MJ134 TaxID=2496865 RepID=UPI000F84E464|nr:hypothetical protein [Maribacter sp. MJ134]AZQ57470.1 hypothetical protein EJ994_01095 [Maribacter sp. MJ134]